MLDILGYLPAKKKSSASGWTSFNAVCCEHNGNRPDRRSRGGIKTSEQGWSYHCFNCNYTASFILGRTVSFKARRLLGWMGVPEREIEMLNLESLRHKSIHGILDDRQRTVDILADIKFEERDLPPFAELINSTGLHRDYVQSRCVPDDYPVMTQTSPERAWPAREQVIIPFTHHNSIVGYTIRFLDDRNPRYINDMQPGYVFGTDLLRPDWTQVIVTEGIFDALSIGGVALMHNTISDAQARLIRNLGKEITVVPDQDLAGMELVDRALELGWAVSMPVWPREVKDVNDAVKLYGRLGTLLTIIDARETSKIKIELRKKQLVKRLNS
jgi:hypothetical protein